MVLVGRQRRNAQNLDHLGHPIDVGCVPAAVRSGVEERTHIPIFDRAAEQPALLDDGLGLQDGVEAR